MVEDELKGHDVPDKSAEQEDTAQRAAYDQKEPRAGQQVDPHAQLKANEAAKIDKAAAEVGTTAVTLGRALTPGSALPGTVVWGETPCDATIDGLTYHKIGEQWRVHLGNIAGHDQYRWLSTKEAQELGLEKMEEVPSARDLGNAPLQRDLQPGPGWDGEPGQEESKGVDPAKNFGA